MIAKSFFQKREELFHAIESDKRIIFGIGIVDPEEIDRINIYQASIMAMLKAVEALSTVPDMLLVDGMLLPHPAIPSQKIVKGDSLSQSIAAASVIAKVKRDQIMDEFHLKWPHYGFNHHKGYGTEKHLQALKEFGPCEIHRRSFEPVAIL